MASATMNECTNVKFKWKLQNPKIRVSFCPSRSDKSVHISSEFLANIVYKIVQKFKIRFVHIAIVPSKRFEMHVNRQSY